MEPPMQGVYQKYGKTILRILFVVLLSFLLVPSQTPAPANHELASEVFDSVIILDSYFISRSVNTYGLHVLVRRDADFIPVQIRMPGPDATYTTIGLTVDPDQHCPFADRQSQAAGIITALERGEVIAYDSRDVLDDQFAANTMNSVDLIVDVGGKLFAVHGLRVSGGCFLAQE